MHCRHTAGQLGTYKYTPWDPTAGEDEVEARRLRLSSSEGSADDDDDDYVRRKEYHHEPERAVGESDHRAAQGLPRVAGTGFSNEDGLAVAPGAGRVVLKELLD